MRCKGDGSSLSKRLLAWTKMAVVLKRSELTAVMFGCEQIGLANNILDARLKIDYWVSDLSGW